MQSLSEIQIWLKPENEIVKEKKCLIECLYQSSRD